MNIKEGSRYVTRNGNVTTLLQKSNENLPDYPWKAEIGNEKCLFMNDGFFNPSGEHMYDLIEEYSEENTKIDVTSFNLPFGILSKEEQKELKNWPYGWEWFTPNGRWETVTFDLCTPNSVIRGKKKTNSFVFHTTVDIPEIGKKDITITCENGKIIAVDW